MIYDSLDKIPSKLFFKIIETEDITLLSDEKSTTKALVQIWQDLVDADNEISNNKDATKLLDVSTRIEALEIKQKAIYDAIYYLRIKEDEELLNMLKSYRYTFTDDLQSDLDKVERYAKDIQINIDKWKLRLPKPKEGVKQVPFDELVFSYGIVTGLGFVDTNKITQSQFRALEVNTKNKIESIKSNG